jgi:hypothetical protein
LFDDDPGAILSASGFHFPVLFFPSIYPEICTKKFPKMKAILFDCLILFLISSCTAQKKTEKLATTYESASQSCESHAEQTALTNASAATETEETEETDIHIVRYDTAQPPDPITGKQPVKEEEFRKTSRKTNEKTNAILENQTETKQHDKQITTRENTAHSLQKTDGSTEVAGGGNFIWTAIIAGLIAGTALAIRIFTRKKSNRV